VKSCRACEKLENAARVRVRARLSLSLPLSLSLSFPPSLLNAKPRHNSFPNRCGVARSRTLPDILILSIRQPFSLLATPRRVDARSYVQLDPSLSLSLFLPLARCFLLYSICPPFVAAFSTERADASTPAFPSADGLSWRRGERAALGKHEPRDRGDEQVGGRSVDRGFLSPARRSLVKIAWDFIPRGSRRALSIFALVDISENFRHTRLRSLRSDLESARYSPILSYRAQRGSMCV